MVSADDYDSDNVDNDRDVDDCDIDYDCNDYFCNFGEDCGDDETFLLIPAPW